MEIERERERERERESFLISRLPTSKWSTVRVQWASYLSCKWCYKNFTSSSQLQPQKKRPPKLTQKQNYVAMNDRWSDHMVTPQNLSETKPTRLQCPLHATHQPHRSISRRVNLHLNQHPVPVSMSCSPRHATSPSLNYIILSGFLICFCLIILAVNSQ